MTTQTDRNDAGTLAVSASTSEVAAGATATLTFEIRCAPPRDLRGQTLFVFDAHRRHAGSAEIIEFDGDINRTAGLRIDAPGTVGDHSWSASLATDSPAEMADAASFNLTVKAHAITALVWDVPPAVTVGDPFTVTVGLKCSPGCGPAGRTFEIYDPLGTRVADGTFGTEVWPSTDALYWAKASLQSPALAPGRYDFTVRVPRTEAPLPHQGVAAIFAVRLVPLPECVMSIEAVDADGQTPLKGARVVMHPYRAVVDQQGIAQLRVMKGTYRLLVSASKYMTSSQPIEVTGDVTTKVQLVLEPLQSIASLYSTAVRATITQGNR